MANNTTKIDKSSEGEKQKMETLNWRETVEL
jgi:hypothetical protein